MIIAPGFRGAAFGEAADGDARTDPAVRAQWAAALEISSDWATIRQVHGARVRRAVAACDLGEGDGIFTTTPGIPMAVATADCFPVVLEGDGGVAIAHAGWRGAAAGIVEKTRGAMAAAGAPPGRAAIGPGIGPCCFEVGSDVGAAFPEFAATTSWGTPSVDLGGSLAAGMSDLDLWRADGCTMCGEGLHSYRRDKTSLRQITVAWRSG